MVSQDNCIFHHAYQLMSHRRSMTESFCDLDGRPFTGCDLLSNAKRIGLGDLDLFGIEELLCVLSRHIFLLLYTWYLAKTPLLRNQAEG